MRILKTKLSKEFIEARKARQKIWGETVKICLLKNSMTQMELADMFDKTIWYINRMLSAKHPCSNNNPTVRAINELFDIEYSFY